MRIALGTTSERKKEYLLEVLKELGIKAEVRNHDVASGISDQPLDSNETKSGSINRARKAISLDNEADIALGIEVGYHPDSDGNYEMFCWTTLIDKNGRQVSAQSHKLMLPSFHQQIIKENKYLGDFVRKFLEKYSDPISQNIGIIIRDRKPFIETATKLALLNYLVR